MTLAFCTDGLYPFALGGMQKHARLLIDQLAKNSDLKIIVLHPHSEKIFAQQNVSEVHISPIDTAKNYILESYNFSKRVSAELSKLQFDVIYSEGFCVWYNIDMFAHKLVVNPHGLEPFQAIGFKNKLIAIPFKLIFKRIFDKAKIVISSGGILTEISNKIIRENAKVQVIPNGVNLSNKDFDRSFNNKITRVLFFARFASNKGIDILFSAINELEKNNQLQNFEFTLAGKGPLYEHYLHLNKKNNVKLIGFVKDEDVETLYEQNDLFVLPTLFEGMPTVVLEAMSKKMPVIVTNVGATSSMVNNENGFLIERNSVSQLVETLLKFNQLSNDEKQKMANSSFQKVVNNFTWQEVARQHLNLFKSITQS